ncbi:unnamed protein product [Rhodiola kirilowii]
MADWRLIFVILTLFLLTAKADPRISEAELHCGTTRAASFSNFINTFVSEMDALSKTINHSSFATTKVPVNASQPIYVLAQGHRDLSRNDCLLCFAASRTRLPRCLPALGGRLYLDGCFLRYDNYTFYHESVDPILDKVNCSSSSIRVSDGIGELEFSKNVNLVIQNVTKLAARNKTGFGAGEVNGVYALAQCWESLSRAGCKKCLKNASRELRGCAPKAAEGRAMYAGCYLRYSTQKFYNEGDELNKHSGVAFGVVAAIVLCTAAFLMFSCFTAYVGYARYMKLKQGRANSRFKISSNSVNKSNLNYKYDALEKATDYFSLSRKLGQGGSGSVYKATCPDGKIVAVKRLIFNTKQWVDEFFNEVNLISGMEHKNLVKLLGCSIEGPESLLVYEYVENKSLDNFIFDKKESQGRLSWAQRLNIIVGTAEGIAHLHYGSATRIIHRDIKSSNVLLDNDLNAKIADFGLVRCFGADQSHLSTGIAGTLGYMAPEYLVRGQLTEKADVYSFGVLLIEIVCGRRNNAFIQGSGCLLQMVWTLYKSNKLSDCVDSSLENNFPEEEARNVILIGLLCTQASAGLRPSMADVVLMLTDKTIEIPEPQQPPFLNASALNPNLSASYSGSSLVSTAPTRYEASYTSSDTSGIQSSNDPVRNDEIQRFQPNTA